MLRDELYDALCELPAVDVHSHISRDQPGATGLGQVVFYHMVQYPLRAADVDETLLWPGGKGFHSATGPFEALFEAWPKIANTGFAWGLRTILKDLYGFDEALSADSLPRLQAAFDSRTARPGWGREILDAAGVEATLSSRLDVQPLEEGDDDLGIRFTVESSPTSGTREYYDWPHRLGHIQKRVGREIRTLDELRELIHDFYRARFDWSDKHALVSWFTSECDFRPADESDLQKAFDDVREGRPISPLRARQLEAAVIRATCEAIRGKTRVFQMCFGVQFLTPGSPHPVARVAPQFASSLGWLFGEFPEIHFNLLNGFEGIEPQLCAHCLAYGNVSLAGYWWETFYPSVMHAAWRRRLDMVPASRLCGFFSDGWCLDWTYARMQMTRRVLANVFAERVEQGFDTPEAAVETARRMFTDTPRELFF
ncbi:MAG: hypothetical protein ACLFV7_11060 [Phycisphaerae bacterium]